MIGADRRPPPYGIRAIPVSIMPKTMRPACTDCFSSDNGNENTRGRKHRKLCEINGGPEGTRTVPVQTPPL